MAEQNSSNCTHNCSTCGANCSSRKEGPTFESPRADSNIKHVIGVISGKGGVGKSIVTSMLAVEMMRKNHKVAILDADITGPSIPKAFGAKGEVYTTDDNGLLPLTTQDGLKMMSVNLLLDDETRPVVWRGPIIAGTVKQFWTDVVWGDIDYMFIDCPPGTGDVPLTIFQTIKLDGIVIVTTPQDLVSMIVKKAVNMANLMNIPVLGMVENMSYVKCPDCGREIHVFGESKAEAVCAQYNMPLLGRIPLDPSLSALCDSGLITAMENSYLTPAAEVIEKL